MGHVIGSGLSGWTERKMCFRVRQRVAALVWPKGNGIWNPETSSTSSGVPLRLPLSKIRVAHGRPQDRKILHPQILIFDTIAWQVILGSDLNRMGKCRKINQIENFALSRECSTLKNAPVFFLFSSLLHFSSGSTMYIGRAKFFEKRENANKTDGKIQKIPRPKKIAK